MTNDKRFTSVNRSHPAIRKPTGYSIIDHSIRFKLKLTVEEYIMADAIYQHNKACPIGGMTVMKYFTSIGYLETDAIRVGKELRNKGIITTDPLKKRPITTAVWNENFDDDVQFEILWGIHHKGNKQEAKINFLKMKSMISFTALCEKLTAYVTAKADEPQYMRDLSGWLNPKLKRWEDIIEYKVNDQEKQMEDMPKNLFT